MSIKNMICVPMILFLCSCSVTEPSKRNMADNYNSSSEERQLDKGNNNMMRSKREEYVPYKIDMKRSKKSNWEDDSIEIFIDGDASKNQ